MGSIFTAQCSCGYESGNLIEGCGMAGPDTCCSLASCNNCQEIVSIRSSSVRPRCPTCRRKVQVIAIDDQSISASKPAALECPQCGKSTMTLTMAGLWD